MIQFRPFLNCDPPAIAEIWCSQPPSRGLVQPMTPALLDQLVLSKPYFDRRGLTLAVENGQPVGFAHAGFGPNTNRSSLDHRLGTTCLLMVVPHADQSQIAADLLSRSEAYLQESGAKILWGGSPESLGPFYLGLYGGCGSPGVLASDTVQVEAFIAAGYEEVSRTIILQRELAGFRPPVDRKLIQLKRQLQLEVGPDVMPADWWEACTFGQIDRTHFVASPRARPEAWGGADFWDLEPLASSWGVHAMGLLQLDVAEIPESGRPADYEEAIMATFLLGESLRQLHSCGVTLVEVQSTPDDELLTDTCDRLGFREVNQGIRFRKPI